MKREPKSDWYFMLCGTDGRLSLHKLLIFLSFWMICGLVIYNITTGKEAQAELITPFTTILGVLGVAKMAQGSYDYRTKTRYRYESEYPERPAHDDAPTQSEYMQNSPSCSPYRGAGRGRATQYPCPEPD
jgi:hypothetical protein